MANVELTQDYGNHKAGEQVHFPATVARKLKFQGIAKDVKPESEEPEGEYPIHKGAGYYELTNGETIRGKDEAIEAQHELNSK